MTKEEKGVKEIELAPEQEAKSQSAIAQTDLPVLAEEKPLQEDRKNEIVGLRTEHRKVFRTKDGSHKAVFYSSPVHVFNEDTETFEDADSTIVADDSGRYFKNNRNNFVARFNREDDNDELFCIEKDMHKVTVYCKKDNQSRNRNFTANISGEKTDIICYPFINRGADYEYSIQSDGVKENIVVRQKANVYRYAFKLKCENVTPRFDSENQRIAFLSNETGKEVFFIPAPFMADANGNVSHSVCYELNTTSTGDIYLAVTADSNWINAPERAFPVTIDPQIKIADNTITVYNWTSQGIEEAANPSLTIEAVCGHLEWTKILISLPKPDLPTNQRIKKAELSFTAISVNNDTEKNQKITLHKVTGDLTAGACNPEIEYPPIDYAGIGTNMASGSKITFDVTELIDSLYNSEDDTVKLVLQYLGQPLENSIQFYGTNTEDKDKVPELSITYEPSYGVNTSWSSHSHQLGRFGSASVDLQSGNLMFDAEDFSWSGNRLPVTLKHLYNSVLSDYQYTANSDIGLNTTDFTSMNIGLGWKLNMMQSIVYSEQNDEYIYIDANGSETYFVLSDKTTSCDVTGQCYNLYEDEDGAGIYYDPKNKAITFGEERYFFDANGRLFRITRGEHNSMHINYQNGRISSITDGAHRQFSFAYNEHGQLISITAPDHTEDVPDVIGYSYTSNLLSAITYPDGTKAQIQYAGNKPSAVIIKNKDSVPLYKVEYTFENGRIKEVVEYGVSNGEFCKGASSSYEYSAAANTAKVTSTQLHDDGESQDYTVNTVYTFDDSGNRLGQYSYTVENNNTETSGGSGINPYNSGMAAISNVDNLLSNNNFETLNGWENMEGNHSQTTVTVYESETQALFGKRVLRIKTNDGGCDGNGAYWVSPTLPAGDYTLSAYVKVVTDYTGMGGSGAYIRVAKPDGSHIMQSETLSKANPDYVRLVAQFTLETEQQVHIQLLACGEGEVYFDGAQLENNAFANRYNMLANSNFENGTDGWEVSDGTVTVSNKQCFNMSSSLYLSGEPDSERHARQQIDVKSAKGTRETFTLSGWAMANSLPFTERENCDPIDFSISAVINYTDDTGERHVARFSPCTEGWQPATIQFAKQEFKEVKNIQIYCSYSHNYNEAYFDNIRLFRNSIETGLSEADFANNEPDYSSTYSASRDMSSFEEVKDVYGNALTQTTFTDGQFGTLYRSFEYNPDCNCMPNAGNDLVSETDSRGNTTHYDVNEFTSRNESVTDRLGNKTLYEYDVNGRITNTTKQSSDGNILSSVSFAYDEFNNLKEITRGDGMAYSLMYNPFHNIEGIKINGKPENLISYTYKNDNGRLKEISYANGYVMKATYNGYGQLIAERWFSPADSNNPIAYYKYAYDNSGNIVRSIDLLSQKEYNYVYDNGRITRATECFIVVDGELNVLAKFIEASIDYFYSADGMLYKKVFEAGNNKITYYTRYPENSAPIVKLEVNGKTIESRSNTDSFGRRAFDELMIGSRFLSRQFRYHEGAATDAHIANGKLQSSPTTNLVKEIVFSDGMLLSYEYDAEERITSVTESYGDQVQDTVLYTYDAQGQLSSETRGGTTVSYLYDSCGNIITKTINGPQGDGIQESNIAYAYNNTGWKDLLIEYNGQAISYDAQGNPTNYLGNTLTWEKGRQLKSFGSNSYTYNANGIRTSKTVGNVKHEYMLEGNKIMREKWGSNTLIPLYDNQNSVCGICYNSQNYFFLKNLQGDVIAITNSDGEIIARYSYDAWGVCTMTPDNPGNPVATINPFRYRGYYYDAEIGMYYLQSRYYDPATGRFINADSPEYASVTGNNLFAYCNNNPVMNVDYFGFCCLPDDYPCYADRQEPGIIETLLKTLGGILGVVSIFSTTIIMDIRRILDDNPWIEKTVSIILIILLIAVLIVIFIAPTSIAAYIIVIAFSVAKTIDNIINIATFDPKSKSDVISLIIDLIIPKILTKAFPKSLRQKLLGDAEDVLSDKLVQDIIDGAVSEISSIFV